MNEEAKKKLDSIIGEAENQVPIERTISGKALQRDGEFIQLAVATGVVQIPSDIISDVTELGTKGFVRLKISDASQIKPLPGTRAIKPLPDPIPPIPGSPFPPVGPQPDPVPWLDAILRRRSFDENTYTDVCQDTSTITAGSPDATDDAICINQVDDIWV